MNESAIFAAALRFATSAERAAYLDQACTSNSRLRAELDALLRAHANDPGFLEQPVGSLEGTLGVPPSTGSASAQPMETCNAEQAGIVLAGRYKLLEAIGEGGMGIVWMAQQTEPVKRKVAVKLIKAGMDSKQVLTRFEAERQVLALMDHPNIAKVHDAGTTAEGRPFFIMELVKGVPITKYCDEHHLTLRQRLELFVPVCQAIQHAHQKGIIHRDLKPSNVLIAQYDDCAVPKVIDFGVAKATGQQVTDQTPCTGFGAIVGTVEYMSPEQASFNQLDVDTRSDIYSLGVLLYELLAGSPPFSCKDLKKEGMLEMLRVIREQEPSKPSTKLSTTDGLPTVAANRGTAPKRLAALVRGELDWIVMKALDKDRDRRYEMANGFAMDVRRYLNDEPVQAGPPSASYRLHKFVRRNMRVLTTASLLAIALVATTGSVGWAVRDRAAVRAEAKLQEEAHVAEMERGAGSALQEANAQLKQGKWPEASAAAKRAAALFAGSTNGELRLRAERVQADLKLVPLLEAIRLDQANLKEDPFDHLRADPAYAAAFQVYGIDMATLEPYVAAEKIRNSVICAELVGALDDWAWVKRKVDVTAWQRLQVVVKLADPDPWRNRFRDAYVKKDRKALDELANLSEVAALPPPTIVLLSRALSIPTSKGANANAAALLSVAQERHPNDFWLNTELAALLAKLKQPHEAAGYYRAALAIRPQSPGTYVGLGNALTESPENLDKAIAAFQAAVKLKPDYVAAFRGLGRAHAKKGNSDEAIAAFRKAIELHPTSVAIHLDLYHELIRQGQIEVAYTFVKGALERGSKPPQWPKIVGLNLNVAIAHRLAESDRKLPAILRGEANPENANDCLGLGKVCYHKQLYGASARFYEAAFRTKPDANHYAGACAAARAGCGQGKDDPPVDEAARARWRNQSLDWLRTDLAALTKQIKSNSGKDQATAVLQKWQRVPDLVGLRNLDQLAKLPRSEQEAWLRLWLDVEALLEQARRKN